MEPYKQNVRCGISSLEPEERERLSDHKWLTSGYHLYNVEMLCRSRGWGVAFRVHTSASGRHLSYIEFTPECCACSGSKSTGLRRLWAQLTGTVTARERERVWAGTSYVESFIQSFFARVCSHRQTPHFCKMQRLSQAEFEIERNLQGCITQTLDSLRLLLRGLIRLQGLRLLFYNALGIQGAPLFLEYLYRLLLYRLLCGHMFVSGLEGITFAGEDMCHGCLLALVCRFSHVPNHVGLHRGLRECPYSCLFLGVWTTAHMTPHFCGSFG